MSGEHIRFSDKLAMAEEIKRWHQSRLRTETVGSEEKLRIRASGQDATYYHYLLLFPSQSNVSTRCVWQKHKNNNDNKNTTMV